MKKILLVGLCCICFCGCGEKKEKKIDSKIENYIKENMPFGYMYREDKINVVDSHLTIYEIQQKDWLDCAFFSKSALESLNAKDISQIGINSITFQCKPNDIEGQAISSVRVGNLDDFEINSFLDKAEIYDEEGNRVSKEDLEIVKQSTSATEAREKIKERDEEAEREKKAKEEQEAKEKAEKEQKEYKEQCESYTYKEIFRNPDDYIGKKMKITGKVIQVIDNGFQWQLRVNMTKDKYGYYDDTIYVTISKSNFNGRILEDDIITFWGLNTGTTTYKTVLGSEMTIPSMAAVYAELVK